MPNFIEIEKAFCGWTYTNGRTDKHLRPTSFGRLRRVDLKLTKKQLSKQIYVHSCTCWFWWNIAGQYISLMKSLTQSQVTICWGVWLSHSPSSLSLPLSCTTVWVLSGLLAIISPIICRLH